MDYIGQSFVSNCGVRHVAPQSFFSRKTTFLWWNESSLKTHGRTMHFEDTWSIESSAAKYDIEVADFNLSGGSFPFF